MNTMIIPVWILIINLGKFETNYQMSFAWHDR